MIVRIPKAVLEAKRTFAESYGVTSSYWTHHDIATATRVLDALDAERVQHHQPYWAVRSHLLRELGRDEEARSAGLRAMGLTKDPAVRAWLQERA